MRILKTVAINRNSADQDRNKEAVKRMINLLSRGQTVIIFAEGTRTAKATHKKKSPIKGKELGVFRQGIQKIIDSADCEIIPVWIEGTDKVLPIESWFPKFSKNVISINIGKPIGEKIRIEELENAILELADNT